jgi:hypothetical protein
VVMVRRQEVDLQPPKTMAEDEIDIGAPGDVDMDDGEHGRCKVYQKV